MPPPAVLLPGAIMAAKHLAFHASMYVDLSTLTSATISFLLAKYVWERIPKWLKEDITFRTLLRRRRRSGNGKDGESDGITREELSHIGSVVDKLQALAQSASIEPVPQLHAALLAYIQLLGQLKSQQVSPSQQSATDHANETVLEEELKRDYLYRSSGKEIPLTRLRTDEYKDALDFATWAYYDDTELLKQKFSQTTDYTIIKHSISSRPGTVAYYLAIDPEAKHLLVGVRGTSSLEDVLTDFCGRAVPLDALEDDTIRIEVHAARAHCILENHEGDDVMEIISGHEQITLEHHDEDGDKFIRCHEGILISAENLVAEIEPLIGDLIRFGGFRLTLCGHSLGAGAAVLAAVILRNHFPECLAVAKEQKIRVYGFAPPPTLDYDSAVSSASFCTSIVCNADIIPRSSLSNLSVLFECLRRVQERLVEEDLIPNSPAGIQAFLIKLSEGISGEPLISANELNTVVEKACEKVEVRRPEHLFIPGTVFLVYNPWEEESESSTANDGKETTIETESDEETKSVAWKCIETDGASPVFRNIEFDGSRPFADHTTSSYFRAMDKEYNF